MKVADVVSSVDSVKMDELSEIVRELVEASTKLVIKLAICECDKKDCPVLRVAKDIAKAIDKIQTIAPRQ